MPGFHQGGDFPLWVKQPKSSSVDGFRVWPRKRRKSLRFSGIFVGR